MAVIDHVFPDSPTNVFATLNPLYKSLDGTPTLTDGNLKAAPNIVQYHTATSTIGVSSGKWYCEILCLGSPNSANYFGVGDIAELNALSSTQTLIGYSSQGYSIEMQNGVYLRKNNTNSLLTTSLGAFGNGDIFNINMDLDNGNIYFGKNGTYANGGSPVAAGLDGTFFIALTMYTNGFSGAVLNTGQDPTFGGTKSPSSTYTDANGIGSFYYQPPTGALALCTANLPSYPDLPIDPALDDLPEDYFKAVKYSGQTNETGVSTWDSNTSTGTVICGFPVDLAWIKVRNFTGGHRWYDTVRGANKIIISNENSEERTFANEVIGFNSTGFNVGNASTNTSGATYVAWCFRAGGAPTTDNTATSGAMTASSVSVDGALQSSYTPAGTPTIYPKRMSVNTKAGFSIVKYGGSNTTGLLSSSVSSATIPHGLSGCDFCIIKNIKWSNTWVVSHSSIAPNVMSLQDAGAANSTPPVDSTYGQITTLGSNTVTITRGTSRGDNVGEDYDAGGGQFEYIMYCWHSVPGFSAFGSYIGNGSTTGTEPFVYTGFKPAWLIIKRSDTTNDGWYIYDNARSPYNVVTGGIRANSANAEDGTQPCDFLSNGFRIRIGANGNFNATNGTYIYAAWAEQPVKYNNAR